MENLANTRKDLMKEVKGLFQGKSKDQARDTVSEANARETLAARAAEDRRQADARAEEIRRDLNARFDNAAQVTDFFRGPGPSERGARVMTQRDMSPQRQTVDRQTLLEERLRLLQHQATARDKKRKDEIDERLIRVERELQAP